MNVKTCISSLHKSIELHFYVLYIVMFIFGIWWSQNSSLLIFSIFFATVFITGLVIFFKKKFTPSIFFSFLCIYLSFFTGVALVQYYEKQHSNFLETMSTKHSFDASVIDIENWYNDKTVLTLKISEPAEGNIKLFIKLKVFLEIGDVIKVTNMRVSPTENKKYEFYLKKESIQSSLFIKNFNYELLYRPIFNSKRWFNNQKERLIKSLYLKMSPTTQAIFFNIFLGKKPQDLATFDYIKAQFNNWGISHFLARSGLHLGCIAFLIFLLLSILPIHMLTKRILILLILTMYSLLTFGSISFARALVTYFFYTTFAIFNKQIRPLDLFFLTAFVILLNNPYQLFFLDFQLSFGITFLILLFFQITGKQVSIEY